MLANERLGPRVQCESGRQSELSIYGGEKGGEKEEWEAARKVA